MSYPGTSNRLTSITGTPARSYTYDAAGNPLSDGTRVFTYNNRGRLKTAKTGMAAAVTYTYNALGQRIKKTGTTRLFVYDPAGHLLGEYNSSGTMVQEFVWLNDIPVAVLTPKTGGIDLFYIHTDHLNTPRKITRPSDNKLRWRWDPDAFGNGTPNQNPQSLGAFVFNLRMPGQYFDSETGLNYNDHRDYDPTTGRYVQSDPIGLKGGINTYAYVGGNPISLIDPYGLAACKCKFAGKDYTSKGFGLPARSWLKINGTFGCKYNCSSSGGSSETIVHTLSESHLDLNLFSSTETGGVDRATWFICPYSVTMTPHYANPEDRLMGYSPNYYDTKDYGEFDPNNSGLPELQKWATSKGCGCK